VGLTSEGPQGPVSPGHPQQRQLRARSARRLVCVPDAPYTRRSVRKSWAAVGSLVFLVVAPGTVAGLGPWWLTGWAVGEAPPPVAAPLRISGAVLVLVGAAALLHAFGRFVLEGPGTPAPVAPPERLVIGGLYRYVRNPMYVAVLLTILGQALVLLQPVLLVYAAVVGAAMASFVYGYEEPTLSARFGAEYDAYRRAVPAWWPRLRPWQPDARD
jgi:protein-S-isoprenylcysteine O-methyltransferase Ste14